MTHSVHHSPGFLKLVEEVRARVQEISIEDVHRKIAAGERFYLIDVREESEFASGRLPGAIHLSKGVIERDIERVIPDQSAPIILYCGGGYRSVLAAENLQRMGYRNVASMCGGWRAWCAAGLPTEHTENAAKPGGA
jgi:rhodanese-related sulfurtransferase